MLCDEILADQHLPRIYPGFSLIQNQLKRAHKFILAPDFTAAADGLVNNFTELARIAPFCRLPFQNCWFELAQADRPHFVDAAMHFPEHQHAVKRVGFLGYSVDPTTPWEWLTHLMWSLTTVSEPHVIFPDVAPGGLITRGDASANNASQVSVLFNTKDAIHPGDDPLTRCIEVCVSPFTPPFMREALKQHNNDFSRLIQSDWGGEVRYLFALLGLLNARNVVEVQAIDNTGFNRKRLKHGNPPLCSHTILKIRAMHRRSLVGVRGKGTTAEVREHFVSGHWKARRTGLFWWNPHWRGSSEYGAITHDYEVTT
jgi:hypothetical protein